MFIDSPSKTRQVKSKNTCILTYNFLKVSIRLSDLAVLETTYKHPKNHIALETIITCYQNIFTSSLEYVSLKFIRHLKLCREHVFMKNNCKV